MTNIRKKIVITKSQDDYIKAQVEVGDCASDSEYVGDSIRRDQEHKMKALRAALLEGVQSGEACRVDPVKFKKRMAERV